jgi:hypothetical protein
MGKWKRSFCRFSSALLVMFLLASTGIAATEFYMLPNGVDKKINCDFVEIKNRQISCTGKSLLIAYDLDRVNSLEVVYEGKSYIVKGFTGEDIKRINDINADKINSKKNAEQKLRGQKNSTGHWMTGGGKLSVASVPEFMQSAKGMASNIVSSSLPGLLLAGAGLVLFLIGDIGFLIAAFRVGVIWGLSCLFLPFVSFFFLVIHWKVAAKWFFVTLAGLGLMVGGAMLSSESGLSRHTGKTGVPVWQKQLVQQQKTSAYFTCSGKV